MGKRGQRKVNNFHRFGNLFAKALGDGSSASEFLSWLNELWEMSSRGGGDGGPAFGEIKSAGQGNVVAKKPFDSFLLIGGGVLTVATSPSSNSVTLNVPPVTPGQANAFTSFTVTGEGTHNASGADSFTLTAGTNVTLARSGSTVTISASGGGGGGGPGAKNSIEIDAGDVQLVGDEATPAVRKYYGTDAGGSRGYHDLPAGSGTGEGPFGIAADFFRPTQTNGALDLQQLQTNAAHPNQVYLGFPTAVDRFAECLIPRMPDDWNLGPVRFRFVWSHPATTTNFDVVWSVQARVTRNDDLVAANFGTAVNVTDTGGTTNDIYVSDLTGYVTPSGTAGANAALWLRIARLGTNGSDNMAVTAQLLGVIMEWDAA